jgi:hypothetical protein
MPNDDVVVCDGVGVNGEVSKQLNEVFDDVGDFAFNSFRIRQPFDFTDRVGRLVFDVDAKFNPENLGHGWWVEFWITEDPAPMPYHESPTVVSFPRNGIGVAFRGFGDCGKSRLLNQVDVVFVSRDYKVQRDLGVYDLEYDEWEDRCFKTADRELNRFNVQISTDRIELWASDYDSPEQLHRIASVGDLGLNFSRGYVHLQHSQYNARKDGNATPVQTYRWDNVGFDGPVHPTPRAYDIPDNDEEGFEPGTRLTGYYLSEGSQGASVSAAGVVLSGATSASFNFTLMTSVGRTLEYRLNGAEWHSFTVPDFGPGADYNGVRTFSAEVPLAELVNGDNGIDLRMVGDPGYEHEVIGNMDLTLELE